MDIDAFLCVRACFVHQLLATNVNMQNEDISVE